MNAGDFDIRVTLRKPGETTVVDYEEEITSWNDFRVWAQWMETANVQGVTGEVQTDTTRINVTIRWSPDVKNINQSWRVIGEDGVEYKVSNVLNVGRKDTIRLTVERNTGRHD